MDVSAATVAVSLKKLEKGRYVKRQPDEGDNRLNKITITEKGNSVVEKSKRIFEAADRKVFEDLPRKRSPPCWFCKKLNANLAGMEDEIKTRRGRD